MAEIDIIMLMGVLAAVTCFVVVMLSIRQTDAERRALQNRPPPDVMADLDDFIRRLDAVTTDEELDKLEQERKDRQWPNSSSPLSSG